MLFTLICVAFKPVVGETYRLVDNFYRHWQSREFHGVALVEVIHVLWVEYSGGYWLVDGIPGIAKPCDEEFLRSISA